MPDITCEVCGQRCYYGQSDIDRGGGKYCSRACYYESKKTRIEFTCEICGKRAYYFPSKPVGRYCSRKCTGIAKRKADAVKANPAYEAWRGMRRRCLEPTHHNYPRYGGRGINVCERWLNSFGAFLEDMGPKPAGMTLDRIDVDGDYEPANCRWATALAQARNRRNTIMVRHLGRDVTLIEYAELRGVGYAAMHKRVKGGQGAEEAADELIRAGFAN